MPVTKTTSEWQASLGDSVRDARLARNLDQRGLARMADISERALRNLESGEGSSLGTVIKVVRALDREDWLAAFDEGADEPTPLELLRESQRRPAKRRRAPRRI
jgi:transcriptional regulator with XRE-family HTH domain